MFVNHQRNLCIAPRFASYSLLTLLGSLFLVACSHTDHSAHIPERSSLQEVNRVIVNADGGEHGYSAYELIRRQLGEKALESPDLYQNEQRDVPSITQGTDSIVGPHFVVSIDRDLDGNKGEFSGRQRNEFKVYKGSDDELKGFDGSTFSYRWKMKIDQPMKVSKHFTHVFQLKPKGGDDATPTLTMTGAKRKGEDVLEIRHFVPGKRTVLSSLPWDTIKGQWLEIECRALFSHRGWLEFSIKQVSDGEPLVVIQEPMIDMWVGTKQEHFQRPKWGIVRSLKDLDNLNAGVDIIRFADIEISTLAEK